MSDSCWPPDIFLYSEVLWRRGIGHENFCRVVRVRLSTNKPQDSTLVLQYSYENETTDDAAAVSAFGDCICGGVLCDGV